MNSLGILATITIMKNALLLDQLLGRIGSKLRHIRVSRNDKVATIAHDMNINISVVSQVENGRYKSLSLDLLSRFVQYYQTSFDELLLSAGTATHDSKDPRTILIDFLIAENKELKEKIDSSDAAKQHLH